MQVQSTHCCFAFMLLLAQVFGMLPVCGIRNRNATFLRFSWRSKRTIYSISYVFATVLNSGLQIAKMARTGDHQLHFGHLVTLLFFAVTGVTVLFFIDVARRWPDLIAKWTEIDLAMVSYGFPLDLHRQLKIVAGLVMIGATVEHLLFLGFMINNTDFAAQETLAGKFHIWFENGFNQVFLVIPYSIVVGFLFQFLNTFSTVAWNFMDLFIMLVSLALAARFKQLTRKVTFLSKKKTQNENAWRRVREHYNILQNLCHSLDDAISNIILLSFANNIFVIVVQIFNTLQRSTTKNYLDKLYYIYSFGFLISRTVAVALFAATIHSESTKLASILNHLTSCVYNVEIERFIMQANHEPAALTGHKLFHVSKSVIFTVAATIVSYELIIIQFNNEIKNFF